MKSWLKATLVTVLLPAASAWAHTPICVCKLVDTRIVCQGGYHDGSRAQGVRIDVIAHDETLLISGTLDLRSRFIFDLPDRPFYVLMDAGPGEIAEVEWMDIAGLAASTWPATVSATSR